MVMIMNKFINKYFEYIILFVGLVITILMTIGIIYLNKKVGTYTLVNNLFGISELLVVLSTFILFLKFSNNKD